MELGLLLLPLVVVAAEVVAPEVVGGGKLVIGVTKALEVREPAKPAEEDDR